CTIVTLKRYCWFSSAATSPFPLACHSATLYIPVASIAYRVRRYKRLLHTHFVVYLHFLNVKFSSLTSSLLLASVAPVLDICHH
ncbi:hypothetical protein BDQ17DRAFT_1373108, partial [Cyathus striatus]